MKQLILASQSPRRKTLLTQLGYQFTIANADINEAVRSNEKPKDYVVRLAKEKAQKVFATIPTQQSSLVVLGADTSVVINDEILGKPTSEADCIATLLRLSDKQHQVLTAIAAINANQIITTLVETQVQFKALTLEEINAYWRTKEPCDKAGSYAIQGIGGQFVTTINGSYSAVVGLPLYETVQILAQIGIPSKLSNE